MKLPFAGCDLMMNKPYLFAYEYAPGIFLCILVSLAGLGLEQLEIWLFGRAWLESLVLTILIGVILRSVLPIPARFNEGIGFSAKQVLEFAVMLLGASISITAVMKAGFSFIIGIAVIVFISIFCSYLIGRLLGLPQKLSVLIACGNSICGNSAIAAAAPVIGARGEDVAASIAFTAVLGVIVVLTLPLLIPVLGLSFQQYGMLAGLTVYAVPQVLAATAPISLLSQQVGTLVKLVRVLMLGPVIFMLALLFGKTSKTGFRFSKMVPWFIIGFIVMMGLRSLNFIPEFLLAPLSALTTFLTIISMAALGLGVDIRALSKAGARAMLTGVLSLLLLLLLSLAFIHLLNAA